MRNKNKEIIEEFYQENFRAPKKKEFIELGGKIRDKCYTEILNELGYEHPLNGQTYQVLNDRGVVVFQGLSKEVAEEFEKTVKHITVAARKGHLLCREYRVVKVKAGE